MTSRQRGGRYGSLGIKEHASQRRSAKSQVCLFFVVNKLQVQYLILSQKMENYSILRTIGKGSYGHVYLAVHKPTGRQVRSPCKSREHPAITPSRCDRSFTCCLLPSPCCVQVALKMVNMSEVKDVQRMTLRLKREIRLMKSLKHENIVEYFERKY